MSTLAVQNTTEQLVMIHSTDELPTKLDGQKGTLHYRYTTNRYKDFYRVLVWKTGEIEVFHKSQLEFLN